MPEAADDPGVIAPAIRSRIEARLAEAAARHGVRVLYAAESGSRAWGFGSPDSDYDVRFVYVHPRDWYLRLVEERDVIEEGVDAELIDLAGWDLRKAMKLLLRSNPALYEWLVSPIVYVDDGVARAALRPLFERTASAAALAHHYASIARGQWQREIEGRSEVKLKKYFYVVRPLLSLAWVRSRKEPPPMQLAELMQAGGLPAEVRAEVEALLVRKRTAPETMVAARIGRIDAWAIAELAGWKEAAARLEPPVRSPDEADAVFRRLIGID